MVSLREEVGDGVSNCIIENSKFLLRHYFSMKYQFKNVEFWGEDIFCQWDSKIAELRQIIQKYK